MKRVTQWMILLTMVFGALWLSSCDNQIKDDMMTPGGLITGSGGGSGSGGSGGGYDDGGNSGGGSSSSALMDFLNYTGWEATDNTEEQYHSLYFRENQAVYNEMTLTDDINFVANYSVSGNTLSFSWTDGFEFDDNYDQTPININNYSLPKSATISSDWQTISFGGRTYEKD